MFGDQKLSFDEMEQKLKETLELPPYYNKYIQSTSWTIGSFFFSTLLSKSSYNAIVSSLVALSLFYLLEFFSKNDRFNNLIEITAATTAGIIVSVTTAL